ncbi:MAG: shikimate dehydrogenase [Myxococcota bacterium]|jgi:shikimate dehydrogenase
MTTSIRAVLFGHPVHHSRSPELFAALSAAGGPVIDFQLEDVPPGQLAEAIARLRGGEWDAAGVTIPYKEDIAALIDGVEGVAAQAGSINAIVRRGDQLIGTNTDGPGFLRAAELHLPGVALSGVSVVILGAGGAARGVAASLRARGAKVTMVTRDPVRRAAVLDGLADRLIAWSDPCLITTVREAALVIQATPVGMSPHVEDLPPLPESAIRPEHRVIDLIYTPWQTRFLAMARRRGAVALNGWPMLVHQAAVAVDFWVGSGAGAGLAAAVGRIEARDPLGSDRSSRGGATWDQRSATCSG